MTAPPFTPLRTQGAPSAASIDTIDAMAELASRMGSVIHVVVAREPGVVDHARATAASLGLALSVDLMASTIRVELRPRSL